MKTSFYKKTTLLFFFLSIAISANATKFYVKQTASGSNNGTNWINAYTELQSALAVASSGDIIWVATGTYLTTLGTDRTISFNIPAGVEVYGGFFGGESTLNPRDFITNETILSGEINGGGSLDNSYHVINTTEAGTNTIVDGFTIQDGTANGSIGNAFGGGWYNYSSSSQISSPQIANCIFKNNFADWGGAIYNSNSTGTSSPVYTNVSFINNDAGTYGGAVYHAGGTSGSNLPVFNNCLFSGNIASDGGAIYTNNVVSIAYVKCTFENNQATIGGAIYNSIYYVESFQTYDSCTFSNNKALNIGGAIYASANSIGNTQTFSHCTFNADSAATSGGAIYLRSGSSGVLTPTITNSNFTHNYATAGGAIYFYNEGDSLKAKVENCIFDTNSNDHIAYNGNCGLISEISNSTFFGATSQAIDLNLWNTCEPKAQFTNCIFWDNQFIVSSSSFYAKIKIDYSIVEQAHFATGTNILENPLFVNAAGGDFQLTPCSPAINSGTAIGTPTLDILQNVRPFPGGTHDMGAYEYQGTRGLKLFVNLFASGLNNGTSWTNAFTGLQSAILLACEGSVIWVAASPDSAYLPTQTSDRDIAFNIPNGVKVYGGFAGNELANYDLSLRNFTTNESILSGNIGFQNDSLDNSYHVIKTHDVNTETLVDGFTIAEGYADGAGTLGWGGGWFNDGSHSAGSTPSINNCHFMKNYATQGGGLQNYGTYGLSSPVLSFCTFSNNRANTGAAVYNYGIGSNSVSNPSFTFCTFSGNEAVQNGGAVYNSGGDSGNNNPSFVSCSFLNNKAVNGGGVYNYGAYGGNSSPFFTKSIFTGNVSSSDGGAIYSTGESGGNSITIIDSCSFTSNMAFSAGAIYNAGAYSGSSDILITVSTFNSNSATLNGGAISHSAYSGLLKSSIHSSTFENNTAQKGGAIYIDANLGVVNDTIKNSTFSNNTATYGGAIYTRNTNGDLNSYRVNGLFNANGGSHLGFEGSNSLDLPSFMNCTFSGVTAYLLDLTNGFTPTNTINFTNSISWNNNGNLVSGSAANDAKIMVNYSIVDEAAFVPGNNNIMQDPLFINLGVHPFSIKCNSPAINMGNLTGAPAKDILDSTRTNNPDIGAYEYVAPLAATISAMVTDGTNPNYDGVPSVTASSIIQNTNNVLLRATDYVLLNHGFEIAPTGGAASVFRAEIGGGCL